VGQVIDALLPQASDEQGGQPAYGTGDSVVLEAASQCEATLRICSAACDCVLAFPTVWSIDYSCLYSTDNRSAGHQESV